MYFLKSYVYSFNHYRNGRKNLELNQAKVSVFSKYRNIFSVYNAMFGKSPF